MYAVKSRPSDVDPPCLPRPPSGVPRFPGVVRVSGAVANGGPTGASVVGRR